VSELELSLFHWEKVVDRCGRGVEEALRIFMKILLPAFLY